MLLIELQTLKKCTAGRLIVLHSRGLVEEICGIIVISSLCVKTQQHSVLCLAGCHLSASETDKAKDSIAI